MQTSKALAVQQLIARLTTVIRRSSSLSSARAGPCFSGSNVSNSSSSLRARSTTRARRWARTLRIEPMPASRERGARAGGQKAGREGEREERRVLVEGGVRLDHRPPPVSALLAHVEDEDRA